MPGTTTEPVSNGVDSIKQMDKIVKELGCVTLKDILTVKAAKMGLSFVDLTDFEVDEEAALIVPENFARKYCLIPVKKAENTLTVAMSDPSNLFAIDDLAIVTSNTIQPVYADPSEIQRIIDKLFVKINNTYTEAVTCEAAEHASKLTVDQKNDEVKTKITSFKTNRNGTAAKPKVGSLLIRDNLINEEQLSNALSQQRKFGGLIGEILVGEGAICKENLYKILEEQLRIPYIDLSDIEIPVEIIETISEKIARRYKLIPVGKDGITLRVAMCDPTNIFSFDDLRLVTGMEIFPLLADQAQIIEKLNFYYGVPEVKNRNDTGQQEKRCEGNIINSANDRNTADFDEVMKKVNEEIAVEINEMEDEGDSFDVSAVQNAPVVKLVNLIFAKAVTSNASDIHIEPYEDIVAIRFRVDGQLMEVMTQEKKILSALVARIKIISGLNIAERRLPQDGRTSMNINSKAIDMRVSVLPTMFGEKVVIRLADKQGFNINKKDLGFFDDDLKKFDEILAHPYGIVLVTGPTGSGKSTTLYTALKELAKPNVNVLTVEDPVECTIRGINQVQVNVKSGLTFATALRAFLRQDPDIIMVGEIRDGETAEIAARAAITGHLVLSTLHTNDSASSITRMIDMGIEPFLISSSIAGVIAQRLVRRLCPKCKEKYKPGINELEALGLDTDSKVEIYMPKGCDACNNTGYKGRIAVYEIMSITPELRELIAKNVSSSVIKDYSDKNGMRTLKQGCAKLVTEGITSTEEMFRVAYSKA